MLLPVTLAENEVEGAEDGGDIRDHVAGDHVGNNGEADKGWGANFHPVGDTATLRVDVKT